MRLQMTLVTPNQLVTPSQLFVFAHVGCTICAIFTIFTTNYSQTFTKRRHR